MSACCRQPLVRCSVPALWGKAIQRDILFALRRRNVPGGAPGLQTRRGASDVPSEFDSHSLPPALRHDRSYVMKLRLLKGGGKPNARRKPVAEVDAVGRTLDPRFLHIMVLGACVFFATSGPLLQRMFAGSAPNRSLTDDYISFVTKMLMWGLGAGASSSGKPLVKRHSPSRSRHK